MAVRDTLSEAIQALDVIDAHEPLGPEADQLREPVDVLTLLAGLAGAMLASAGMPAAEVRRMGDPSIPVEQRWRQVEPFYRAAANTGPVRVVRETLAGLFGVDRLDAGTVAAASEKVAAAYQPGLYRRILQDACQIETCIQFAETAAGAPPATRTVLPIGAIAAFGDLTEFRSRMERLGQPADLSEYLGACRRWLAEQKAAGVVGLKAVVEAVGEPDPAAADDLFRRLKNGDVDLRVSQLRPLRHYLLHEAVELAGELGLVVALSCGTGGFLWEDFTRRSPQLALGLLADHRATRFDLLVGGLPWMRSVGVLAARFPNVSVSLSITPVISERLAAAALAEWLQIAPVGKVLAFGGNHRRPVPNVYGHLAACRRVVVEVLAEGIDRGELDVAGACQTAAALLEGNARRLYGL